MPRAEKTLSAGLPSSPERCMQPAKRGAIDRPVLVSFRSAFMAFQFSMNGTVYFTPMPNVVYHHFLGSHVYFVYDTIIARSNPIQTFRAG